jgi:hypothetical protein
MGRGVGKERRRGEGNRPQVLRDGSLQDQDGRPKDLFPGYAIEMTTRLGMPVRLLWGVYFGHIVNRHVGRHLHIYGGKPKQWIFFPDVEMVDARELVRSVVERTLERPQYVIEQQNRDQIWHVYVRLFDPPVVAAPGPVPVVVPVNTANGEILTAYPSTAPAHQPIAVASGQSKLHWVDEDFVQSMLNSMNGRLQGDPGKELAPSVSRRGQVLVVAQ